LADPGGTFALCGGRLGLSSFLYKLMMAQGCCFFGEKRLLMVDFFEINNFGRIYC